MIKVLLLSYAEKNMKFIEPLGICYLASVLRSCGHFVKLLDSRVYDCNLQDFAKIVIRLVEDFDLVGITSTQVFSNKKYIDDIKYIIKEIKDSKYNGHITMGGYGPTIEFEQFIKLNIDSIVIGEGEITLCNLANAIDHKENWKEIKGIAYKDLYNNFIKNTSNKPPDLNEIPYPSRDILDEFNKLLGKYLINPSIQGSRGCYMRCSFCSTPKFIKIQGGESYRLRSIKNIVDEIELLHNLGYNNFDFIDDNFLPVKYENALSRAIELKNELQDRDMKITFFLEFRLENITMEILDILKNAGLRRLFIGIESFNEDDLKLYNRNYTVDNIYNSINIINESGFKSELNSEYRFKFGYINFNPLSTIESLKNTGKMFKKYNFTYKKLTKRLYIYNNNNVLKKVLRHFPKYSEENYFKDARVRDFYELYLNYNKSYLELRNHCRNIEKYINRLCCNNVDNSIINKVTKLRKKLDDNIYYIYMNGLDACSEPYKSDNIKNFFNQMSIDNKSFYNTMEVLLNNYDKLLGINNCNFKYENFY